MQRLLVEKDKYNAIIAQSFGRDKSFQNTLNQAFEHFINLNQRSPEFISLFMDDKLRKGLKVCSPSSPYISAQSVEYPPIVAFYKLSDGYRLPI